MALDKFFMTADVARAIGISESRVRQLVEQGVLPCTRTAGGMRLYAPRDVARLAAERGRSTRDALAPRGDGAS